MKRHGRVLHSGGVPHGDERMVHKNGGVGGRYDGGDGERMDGGGDGERIDDERIDGGGGGGGGDGDDEDEQRGGDEGVVRS